MLRLSVLLALLGLIACSAPATRSVGKAPVANDDTEPAQPEPAGKTADPELIEDDEPEPDPPAAKPTPKAPAKSAPVVVKPKPHPLAGLTDKELEARLLKSPASLGSMSIGRPGSGALFNGKQMPKGKGWKIVNPRETWGTAETIDALVRCITIVNKKHPKTPPLRIGDISDRDGGHLVPHLSHQSGRDVDAGYYYIDKSRWYAKAGKRNLDVPRTWTLIKAIITESDIERIFMDISIQRMLKAYAAKQGEDPAWLDSIFGGPLSNDRPIIKHISGHATHVHLRFYNPIAQETGRRMYKLLLAHNKIKPPTYYIKHRARRGDTLSRLARRYKTTVRTLKRANGLRSSRIYRGRTYRIPRKGGVAPVGVVRVPPRRLPPKKSTAKASTAAR